MLAERNLARVVGKTPHRNICKPVVINGKRREGGVCVVCVCAWWGGVVVVQVGKGRARACGAYGGRHNHRRACWERR